MEFDPEEFEEIFEDCVRRHSSIDEGIRTLLQNNSCWHFKPFGKYMIGRSLVISEVIDQVGDMHLVSFASKGLRPWEIKGMLNYVNDSF